MIDSIEREVAAELALLRETSSTWTLYLAFMTLIVLGILGFIVAMIRHHRAPVHIDAELYQIWKWRAAARGMTVEQWLEDMTRDDAADSRS